MSLFRRGDVWWYEFWFAGRRIQESSKSPSKTIARTAEQDRRRELEEGFNNFTDTRHVTTLKTAWSKVRENAGVTGRWHDNRHTLITELAESGAGDQTIMDIAGHVSKQMPKHYSHIRMAAKRTALESIVRKQTGPGFSGQPRGQAEGFLQKSLHGLQNEVPWPTSNSATVQPANPATSKKGTAMPRIARKYAAF